MISHLKRKGNKYFQSFLEEHLTSRPHALSCRPGREGLCSILDLRQKKVGKYWTSNYGHRVVWPRTEWACWAFSSPNTFVTSDTWIYTVLSPQVSFYNWDLRDQLSRRKAGQEIRNYRNWVVWPRTEWAGWAFSSPHTFVTSGIWIFSSIHCLSPQVSFCNWNLSGKSDKKLEITETELFGQEQNGLAGHFPHPTLLWLAIEIWGENVAERPDKKLKISETELFSKEQNGLAGHFHDTTFAPFDKSFVRIPIIL